MWRFVVEVARITDLGHHYLHELGPVTTQRLPFQIQQNRHIESVNCDGDGILWGLVMGFASPRPFPEPDNQGGTTRCSHERTDLEIIPSVEGINW
jgi:hypothetical protein